MNPCHHCHYRHVGCQIDCLSYKNFKAELERIRQIKESEQRSQLFSKRTNARAYSVRYSP